MKQKIGIVFGGFSNEREISFAGGRTVYDNLNKSLFEAIPLFVDSFGNFIELNWEYIYKGSIRDFYPPVNFITDSPNQFQVYAESLYDEQKSENLKMAAELGRIIPVNELKQEIDFAFLCLHGKFGEDGTIQGLLDFLGIPYSGSGIFPSAVGINKTLQKQLMLQAGFNCPLFFRISKKAWDSQTRKDIYKEVLQTIGEAMVVKAPTQGSSIGISILKQENLDAFVQAVNKSLFRIEFTSALWNEYEPTKKIAAIRQWADIREGIGMPVILTVYKDQNEIHESIVYHPEKLLEELNNMSLPDAHIKIEALDGENEILIEQFIQGKEFSCIVTEHYLNEVQEIISLPPTEIRKGQDFFDYRSKYLPGLARKITPIDLPQKQIEEIAETCKQLFKALHFDVYARIDGFITSDNKIYLNDPNTTSGMMPSSFFFHQAAEIGLNPSQFLTFIISTSLYKRALFAKNQKKIFDLYHNLHKNINKIHNSKNNKICVGVILGGYSSERHISVESGRNIYEKLSSSEKYAPIPIFLTGNNETHKLYILPVNILLKDNADDIKEKVINYNEHPYITTVKKQAAAITSFFAGTSTILYPQETNYESLNQLVDVVFIALHGRPGEDGAVQSRLEKLQIPYNGSGVNSSQITINKYQTNEILMEAGLSVAKHILVKQQDWLNEKNSLIAQIERKIRYPFIAKPVDDGCSSAVKKIKNRNELEAFATLIFRAQSLLLENEAEYLKIKTNEEFPQKKEFLIEELITANGAIHFLEITGGMLTRYNHKNEIEYEIFEASETLAEGEILSLEEKFLAGQGQNITPARYSTNKKTAQAISDKVKDQFEKAARILNIEGYARIDAFVRVYDNHAVEVVFIEVNSLPGMTPATCIFHQTALNKYKPYDFIDKILEFGQERRNLKRKDFSKLV